MTAPWKGSRVTGRWLDIGTWLVVSIDGDWCETVPRNPTAERLAAMSPTGVTWFRKQDLNKQPDQKETLL